MKLVTMKEVLAIADKGGYALGAFEFWSYDSAQAVLGAAQKVGVPVILQNGGLERDYAGGCERMYKIASDVAADFDVPVALHYDHGMSFDEVKDAAESGYTSLMIDASHSPYAENVAVTRKVVELAKKYNISTESELGVLDGEEGGVCADVELQTKPEEAESFVRDTGVDCLAVAIGTSHGFYRRPPKINIPLLQEIKRRVDVPIVLHGGSGTPEEQVREAIRNGIRKVNICTEFVRAFGVQYIETQAKEGFKYSIPSLFGPSKEAGMKLAESKIKLFALK